MMYSIVGYIWYYDHKKHLKYETSGLPLEKIHIKEIMVANRTLLKFPWLNGKCLSHSDLVCLSTDNKWYIIKNLIIAKSTIVVKEFKQFQYYRFEHRKKINKTLAQIFTEFVKQCKSHDYTMVQYNCHYDAKHFIDYSCDSPTDNIIEFFQDIGQLLA